MEHLDGAAASPTAFDGYRLVLIQSLKEGDSKQLEKLTPHLGTIVEACVSCSELSSILRRLGSKCFILTTELTP
jgi:hypothetical protein